MADAVALQTLAVLAIASLSFHNGQSFELLFSGLDTFCTVVIQTTLAATLVGVTRFASLQTHAVELATHASHTLAPFDWILRSRQRGLVVLRILI